MLALLKSFDDTRSELGVAEIARTLGVHKSTASRLAAAFRGRDVEKTYWALLWGVPDVLEGRIDLPLIRSRVEAAGYRGFQEVEIFSDLDWWKRDPDEVLRTCKERLAVC